MKMRLPDILSLSTRMFKTRPMRTFLTVLGVGVGIGTVLFLVSLGYGLQNVILSRIASADSLLTLDVTPGPSKDLTITDKIITDINALPEVAQVSRMKNIPAQITIGDVTGNGIVQAVDPPFFRLRGDTALAGSLFDASQPTGVVLSSAATRLFNVKPKDILGKTLRLTLLTKAGSGTNTTDAIDWKTPYTIVGVLADDNVSYAFVPLASLSDLHFTAYDQLKVKVKGGGVLDPARTALIAKGLVVAAISDTIDQAAKIFRIVQIVLALFGLVALTVSAIGMFNTMTIALLERINEIGIMRAIGVRKRDLQMLFLAESMLMGFLGGVGGVALGMLGGVLANAAINLLASHFGGPSLNLFYSPTWFIVVIISFSTIIGFLTGLYPSRRASHLNPLDALRYK